MIYVTLIKGAELGKSKNIRGLQARSYSAHLKHHAVASKGMVSTNHPLASAVGVEILAKGGNAIDAAVGAIFCLTVVEPNAVGIFGAGFFVTYIGSTGEIVTYDNYARAPARASANMYETDDASGQMETIGKANRIGHLSVGVPGALAAWCHALRIYGRLDLEAILEPAVRYAERGFQVTPLLASYLHREKENLWRFPASRAIFFPGDRSLKPKETLIQSDYGDTLRRIGKKGSDILYHGLLGQFVSDEMESNGGIITTGDLGRYSLQAREPVRGTYRGHEVVSMGPASSGGIHVVQALNLLEHFDVGGMEFGSAQYFHLILEVLKVCWIDRFAYLGDPDIVEIPLNELISKEYAAKRASQLDMGHAQSFQPGTFVDLDHEPTSTTHVTTADDEGNLVTTTQTLNESFGSRVVVPGTGMLLNNCMALFDPHSGRPNSIGPNKRMISSMAPTVILKDGQPFFALGAPGGTRIFAAVLQAIINVIDHKMTLQQSVEASRVWTQGKIVEVEDAIGPEVIYGLGVKGHEVLVVPKVAGGMNGIMFDQAGLIYGAACWRADGSPVGISGGSAAKLG